MIITQSNLPEVLRRIGTTAADLRAIKNRLAVEVANIRCRLANRVAPPGCTRAQAMVIYNKRWRRKNILNGLTWIGTHRKRPWRDQGGLSRDHAAYMRFWRENRRNGE